jgi:hypothetical protein
MKEAKPMRPCRTLLFRILPLAVLVCLSRPLHAEEGAGGQYIPGAYASLLNITPNKPAFAVGNGFYFYTGSAGGGKTFPFGGLLASNLNANVYFDATSLVYTFCPTILGAHYTVAVAIPYVWLDVKATVSINPRLFARVIGTRTKTLRDSANGVSDMAITPVALNWTFGDLQINPQFVVYAPTGDYTKGQLANLGRNHWMFDTILGLSYLSHKTGTEFTLFGGFAVSTENNTTNYQNGDLFHLEATLQQFLPLSKQTLVGIGANAFYYEQVTGDSGPGAVLGDFAGTDIGVGPVVTLIHTSPKYNFSAQVKWLPDLQVNNRLRGNAVWVSVGLQW